jgi:hypothetical protein
VDRDDPEIFPFYPVDMCIGRVAEAVRAIAWRMTGVFSTVLTADVGLERRRPLARATDAVD